MGSVWFRKGPPPLPRAGGAGMWCTWWSTGGVVMVVTWFIRVLGRC
jgi:hypothetical protein